MVVKIRLKRLGAIHRPYYRIIVIDSRKARNGRAIEEIGYYHPVEKENQLKLSKDRAEHWLKLGAQPTDTVKCLLNKSGVFLR
ncbi:30S ribosomal protein S16 [Candidatus Haliotispira prima]|uniref:Small ribosomal subunit protein bS16 n=1 Tax=Candidatus Haliotispira prima TaxID=3034016 RepID=A0ABY8MKL2_9SPIO|nr:30S ribosomal protein S16 [Candidatus Haliotispira prima]